MYGCSILFLLSLRQACPQCCARCNVSVITLWERYGIDQIILNALQFSHYCNFLKQSKYCVLCISLKVVNKSLIAVEVVQLQLK